MEIKAVIALVAVAVAGAVAAQLKAKKHHDDVVTRARTVMTKHEQPMYWRLREAFPDAVVLAQVAFSALITSERRHRNRFSQKVADFVLCDRAMKVMAVIELDDSSHNGRAAEDDARAALLERAGYRVVRFQRVPDVEPLRQALSASATERRNSP